MTRTRTLALLAVTIMLSDGALAAAPRPVRRAVPGASAAAPSAGVSAGPMTLAKVKIGEVVCLTTMDGSPFWQARLDNRGTTTATNVLVPGWLSGFMPRSEKACHGAPVASIPAGGTAYVRGPLPLFPGAHLLKLSSPGDSTVVELPRPYREDADGRPETAQLLESFVVSEAQGKLRVAWKMNVNIFEPIKKGAMCVSVYYRLRKKVQDDPLWTRIYPALRFANDQVIPTGGRWATAELVDLPPGSALSRYFDRVAIRFAAGSGVAQVRSAPVLKRHWEGCSDMENVLEFENQVRSR